MLIQSGIVVKTAEILPGVSKNDSNILFHLSHVQIKSKSCQNHSGKNRVKIESNMVWQIQINGSKFARRNR